MEDKYTYNRFGSKGARVGQAVTDILSKQMNEQYTAEDILDAYSKDFYKGLEEALDEGAKVFQSPFYIVFLASKEMWADNVVRTRWFQRQTKPKAAFLVDSFPNHMKSLFIANKDKGAVELLYTLPGLTEIPEILKNPLSYDKKLVDDILAFKKGELDDGCL